MVINMVENLGELLRAARVRLGWDQAQLARQLGTIGQQSVSRWERGTSRPRKAMIPQIASVLGIEAQAVLDAMAADRPPSSGVSMPVRPLLTELPLGMLAEDVFERFSTDLAHQLYPHPDVVHGYGSRGHKQGGIDIEVCHPEGLPTGIQCKRAGQFGPDDVRDAVEALTLEVRECVIFLSRVASPGARQEIARHPGWQLRDVADISREVRNLTDQVAAIRLVDTYFPGYREAFLGVAKPSPWETPEAFFRPLSGNTVFTHGWDLVGRSKELDSLAALFQDTNRRVALVVGPGGIGKSRLLRQFGLDMSQPGPQRTAVLFAAADMPVEPAEFEQLPNGGRLAVVVEDAHARPDAAAIVHGTLRRHQEARIVFSVRPYALADLQNDLRSVGVYPDDCMTVVLDELSVPDAQILAREALGNVAQPGLAAWLGAVAPDCPLLIVVAAALIRRGSLDPARLPGSDRIREEIMEAFRDAMTAGANMGNPDVRREVLNAVAALQPFRLDDGEFRSAISDLTRRPFDQVMPYLSALEAAQVLQRRGASLRVAPDLLGDAVLAGACVDTASGVATGYLERAFQAADGAALAHLFVNGSRVDWQIRQSGTRQASLIEPLWECLSTQFAHAGIDGRVELLRLLKKVAAFQPGPALALAGWALSNPIEESGTSGRRDAAAYAPGYQEVRNELAPLLENVAYNLSHLNEAADLLWQLAGTDVRKPNQFPDHPIRVLSRLMEYAPTTPLAYQEKLLTAAAGWLDRPDVAELPYSPFDVLDVLLATEAVVQSSDGPSLTMRSYPVAPDAVRSLRNQVTDLAFAELRSADVRRAVRAARTIGAALIGPLPAFNRVPDQAEKDRWTPGFIEIITRIGSIATDAKFDPAVVIALREALRWHYQYSSTQTRTAAQKTWRSLPDSIEHRLALVLHDGWGTLLGDDDGSGYQQEKQDALFAAVIAQATGTWPDTQLLDQLERQLDDERAAFGNDPVHASPLVWRLAEAKPSIADELCSRVIQDQDTILCSLVPPALGRLLDARPADGLARTRELLRTGNLTIVRNVANTLGWGRGRRTSLLDGEADLLRSLVRHEDPVVRQYTIFAARALSQAHPALAKELVTTVRFTDSGPLADDVTAAFSGQGYLRWSDLSDSQARSMLSQLADCPSISEYHVTVLLAEICSHEPEAVADLLIQRIETWEQASSPLAYDPLPHIWHQTPTFNAHPQYGDLLRKIHQWMTRGLESWRRQHAGSELFAVVAGNFGQETLSVLREALTSGDTWQVRAVGSILQHAPRTLLWDQVEFVCLALSYASQHGEKVLQQVAGGLHAAAINGMRFGTPQQPFGENVEQRDKSAEILTRLPRGSLEEKFYQALAESAQRSIQWKTQLDDTLTSRRDW
jgi:transcriptional regulator with XRE-family HTH domain